MWSQVYSYDMFGRFRKDGIFNKTTGRDYRRLVIGPGGSRDANDMLRDFLGREPSEVLTPQRCPPRPLTHPRMSSFAARACRCDERRSKRFQPMKTGSHTARTRNGYTTHISVPLRTRSKSPSAASSGLLPRRLAVATPTSRATSASVVSTGARSTGPSRMGSSLGSLDVVTSSFPTKLDSLHQR